MRKDSRMSIPGRVAAWLCVGVLGFGAQVRAEDVSSESQYPASLEQPCGDGSGEPCMLGGVERRQVVDDIFEYSYPVRVGHGTYDVITLHRVVRELAPGLPVRTPKSVFLVHGD